MISHDLIEDKTSILKFSSERLHWIRDLNGIVVITLYIYVFIAPIYRVQ